MAEKLLILKTKKNSLKTRWLEGIGIGHERDSVNTMNAKLILSLWKGNYLFVKFNTEKTLRNKDLINYFLEDRESFKIIGFYVWEEKYE